MVRLVEPMVGVLLQNGSRSRPRRLEAPVCPADGRDPLARRYHITCSFCAKAVKAVPGLLRARAAAGSRHPQATRHIPLLTTGAARPAGDKIPASSYSR